MIEDIHPIHNYFEVSVRKQVRGLPPSFRIKTQDLADWKGR